MAAVSRQSGLLLLVPLPLLLLLRLGLSVLPLLRSQLTGAGLCGEGRVGSLRLRRDSLAVAQPHRLPRAFRGQRVGGDSLHWVGGPRVLR